MGKDVECNIMLTKKSDARIAWDCSPIKLLMLYLSYYVEEMHVNNVEILRKRSIL